MDKYFKKYPSKKIKRGEVILQQDDMPSSAYVVKKGVVKVYNLTAEGEEKSLSFKVEDDLFPICWIFSKTKTPLFYYEAHADCELYVVPREDIIKDISKDSEFSWRILDKQVNSYVNNELQIEALEQSRAGEKLLYTLRYLALVYGEDISSDRVKIKVPMTQQELANFIGLTRETVAGELVELKKAKTISTNGKFYVVNSKKLGELIDDGYNPGIKNS